MSEVSFCTAVTYGNLPKSACQSLLEGVDSYFYLGGKKAQVITGEVKKGNQDVRWITEKPSLLSTCAKIISYAFIIIPLILFIAKILLRSSHHFRLIQENPSNPKSIHERLSPVPDSGPHIPLGYYPESNQQIPTPKPDTKQPPPQKEVELSLPQEDIRESLPQEKVEQSLPAEEIEQSLPVEDDEQPLSLKSDDEITKDFYWSIQLRQYDKAYKLLTNKTLPDHLRPIFEKSFEVPFTGEVALAADTPEHVQQGLKCLKALRPSDEKDTLLQKVIIQLAEKEYFKEAIDLLLNQSFFMKNGRLFAIQALNEALNIEVKRFENNNKIVLVRFFLEKQQYEVARKITETLPNSDRKELEEKIKKCEKGELQVKKTPINKLKETSVISSY